MGEWLCGRVVLAVGPGMSMVAPADESLSGCTLVAARNLRKPLYMAPPAEAIPVLPERSSYRGQPLAVLAGPDWETVDRLREALEQVPAGANAAPVENEPAAERPKGKSGRRRGTIYETTITSKPQLHHTKETSWVQAKPSDSGFEIVVPTQWPGHVARSVAGALGVPGKEISVVPVAPGVTRDAAALLPTLLAVLTALAADAAGRPVLLTTTISETHLSGGRMGFSAAWKSVLDEDGKTRDATVAVELDVGAFPSFVDEIGSRITAPHNLIYGSTSLTVATQTSDTVPLALFEGLVDSQFSFAREAHVNEMCGEKGWDPVEWRLAHLDATNHVAGEVTKDAAEKADFHRRYASNRARLRRTPLLDIRGHSSRGIGIALASQQCGFLTPIAEGSISVRLEQDNVAVLRCSLPAANPELKRYWRLLVATHLDVEESAVLVDDEFVEDKRNSGPALLSRGVSIVPRAIRSACDAIRRQRFRAPLPISVTRNVRIPKSGKTPADFGTSLCASVVEAEFHPSSVEFDIRSVHLTVYGGAVVNRAAAESEVRRGVFQALAWVLHEGIDHGDSYDTTFRGRPPRVSISFFDNGTKDVPTGVAELPFSTVPAATVSALSQAIGIPIRGIPIDLPLLVEKWGRS